MENTLKYIEAEKRSTSSKPPNRLLYTILSWFKYSKRDSYIFLFFFSAFLLLSFQFLSSPFHLIEFFILLYVIAITVVVVEIFVEIF